MLPATFIDIKSFLGFPGMADVSGRPLLSVVIPTLNRPLLLRETLLRIAVNYPVADSDIEFLVVDNASDRALDALISELSEAFGNKLTLVRFETRLQITESFSRAVSCSRGKYVQIFGDDDLAFGLIGFRLMHILRQEPISLIYINRLIGGFDLSSVAQVAHPSDAGKDSFKLHLSEFVSTYTHWPGFITSLVFARSAWDSGIANSESEYPGYTFLDYLYRSSVIDKVLVIAEPSVIQRRGIQDWKKMWPLYWYQGMGRLLADLDRDQISERSLDAWLDHEIKLRNHIVDLLLARSFPEIYGPAFWREIALLFNGRVVFQFFVRVIRLSPPLACRLILRLSPNREKYGKLA